MTPEAKVKLRAELLESLAPHEVWPWEISLLDEFLTLPAQELLEIWAGLLWDVSGMSAFEGAQMYFAYHILDAQGFGAVLNGVRQEHSKWQSEYYDTDPFPDLEPGQGLSTIIRLR